MSGAVRVDLTALHDSSRPCPVALTGRIFVMALGGAVCERIGKIQSIAMRFVLHGICPGSAGTAHFIDALYKLTLTSFEKSHPAY